MKKDEEIFSSSFFHIPIKRQNPYPKDTGCKRKAVRDGNENAV